MGFKILGLVPEIVKPLAETLMVLVAVDDHVQLGVVAEAGEGEVGGSDHGDAVLVIALSIVENVGLGVEAALGEDLDL